MSSPRDDGMPAPATSVVLVADAHRLLADALACALDRYDDLAVVPARPVTGADALAAATLHRPDVALLDYWLPGLSGPAVTRALGGSASPTKVLLLSWAHGQPHVQEALAAGATGFLPKSLTVDQVAHAVRQAAAGEALVYGEKLARLVDDIESRREVAEARWERLQTLTPRELEILQALCGGEPLREVAQDLCIAVGTLKNHLHSIIAKVGARSAAEAVTIARKEGLVRDRSMPPRPGSSELIMPTPRRMTRD